MKSVDALLEDESKAVSQIPVIFLTAIWKQQLRQHAPTMQNDLGVASDVHCQGLTSAL
jgi:hypothetical protein